MSTRIFIVLIVFTSLLAVLVAGRWIVKLPSKYERKPVQLSSWNSLDIGIDPSITESGKQ